MILNKSYKYWEFYYDDDPDESDRQNLASLWSESWHNVDKIYNMPDEEIKEMLEEDIEQYNLGKLYSETKNSTEPFVFKPISKRFIGYAIKELKKIKEELPLDKIHEM